MTAPDPKREIGAIVGDVVADQVEAIVLTALAGVDDDTQRKCAVMTLYEHHVIHDELIDLCFQKFPEMKSA